jgi:hypothetical protein
VTVLPGYSLGLNPGESLWAWFKRQASATV